MRITSVSSVFHCSVSSVLCTAGLLLLGLVLAGASGCDSVPKDKRIAELEEENRRLQTDLQEKDARLVQQANTIADQTKRIETLVALGPDRLSKLYFATRIIIDSLTGGADYNGKPGDDGITVYLSPVDRDGHIVKVAGEIRIQLLDLAMPEGQKTIGEYYVDVDHAREHWYGRFLTNHYTIKCEWRPDMGPPKNREITARVEFTDYLTGNKLISTKTCTVNLPPSDPQTQKSGN